MFGHRLASFFLLIGIVLSALTGARALAQSDEAFEERLTVVRYLVDVRVMDASGRALTDLEPEDFTVTVGGRSAFVESATWVGSNEGRLSPILDESSEDYGRVIEEPPGRLLVLFIQTDFGRNYPRIVGHLAFNPMADEIIELLEPNDRVAVFQHDSHLKMRLDFSLDREALRKAVRDSIRIEKVPMPEMAIGPSLVRHLDYEAMKASVSTESSLLLIARALRELEGTKLMILAGWGLGETQGGRLAARRRALGVLHRDKVPVISISTGVVGGSLTPGMRAIAVQTGGTFAGSTQDRPQQALARVAGALAGYYELVLRLDEPLQAGLYPISVATSRRGAVINAPPVVIIDSPGSADERITLIETPRDDSSAEKQSEARELFSRAMHEIRNGDKTSPAEQLLTDAIAIEPGFAMAWYERGMLAAGRGEFDKALRDLRKYLELAPNGAHAPSVREMVRSFDAAQ